MHEITQRAQERLNNLQCPKCKAPPPTLVIEDELIPERIGSYSLAGVTFKVPAQVRPVLKCQSCDFRKVGTVTDTHVVF